LVADRPEERFIPNRPSLSALRLNVETRLRSAGEVLAIARAFDATGASGLGGGKLPFLCKGY